MGLPVHANVVTCTFTTSSDGLSTVVDIEAYPHIGFIFPSAWSTGSTSLTFLASETSGGTFVDVFDDDGTEIDVVAAPSHCVTPVYNAISVPAARYLKFRSGGSTGPVAQSTNVTLKVLLKG